VTNASGVREGEVLAGKYRVDRVLGAGGMGVVVAAHHLELDERVAIKFLLPDVLAHGDAVARFTREARAAVKIKSEHVAKVTDVGKLDTGAPYMVMEYLDGSDLSGWLKQRGPLPIEQAVEFVLQACEAIAEAHSLGIVHRDLKPANLFVIRRPDGGLSVKVLDFGISKTTGPLGAGSGGTLTATSALMGSPLYMSPEQMQSSRDVDARTDIWALGVILYELVTGALPFVADTMPELVLRVVQGAPPDSMRFRLPGMPEAFEAVVFRCLDRDRRRRFESISEFASALAPFGPKRSRVSVERIAGVLRSAGLSATALAPPPSSDDDSNPPAGATATAASWGKTANPRRRGSWLLAGAALVTVLAGGIAWRTTHESATATASASAMTAVNVPSSVPPAEKPPAYVATTTAPSPAVGPTTVEPAAVTEPVGAAPKSTSPSALVRHAAGARTKPSGAAPAAKPEVTAVPVEPPHPTAQPAQPPAPKPNIFDDRK
jgi:serine/threonine protein kinase